MRYQPLCILLLHLCMTSCTPVAQSSVNSNINPKALRLTDFTYEPQIRTVELAPEGQPMEPAVTQLGMTNLMLMFDDLRSERESYYARIIHCQFDWTRSELQDLDYLTAFNEFPI
ncbi:MAG TPA: type IX secretion system plug protein domain-containing protein, partial [Chryseolinea sp.]|nr:type IX secretion system plug protein domain-containing protein [Chryseolinea sp.]